MCVANKGQRLELWDSFVFIFIFIFLLPDEIIFSSCRRCCLGCGGCSIQKGGQRSSSQRKVLNLSLVPCLAFCFGLWRACVCAPVGVFYASSDWPLLCTRQRAARKGLNRTMVAVPRSATFRLPLAAYYSL